MLAREKANKLLGIPFYAKIWLQWLLLFGVPVTIVFGIKEKKWVAVICLSIFSLFYSYSSLAKSPVILLCIEILIIIFVFCL